MKRLIFILTAIFVLFASNLSAEQGKPVKYSDLKKMVAASDSRLVLVNIFSMYCPACRQLLPTLNDLKKTYAPDQLSIVGIALDDPDEKAELDAYIKKSRTVYPVFLGDENLAATLKVRYIPRTLLYASANGELLDDWTGVPEMKDLARSINTHSSSVNKF